MYHALGAGTVPLPVKAALQVWNGSAFSAFSGTCSSLSLAPSQVAMSFPDASKLAACDTRISMSSGLSSLSLSAPGGKKNGWVDLTWNLGAAATGTTCIGASASAATTANATWLQSGASYNANPTARARFGIRGNRRAVYLEAR
jgi:MSHA biogenesis protein MshQ